MRYPRLTALLCLLAMNASADEPRRVHALLGLTFGWDWAQVGETQTAMLVMTDPAPDNFKKNSNGNSQPLGGAYLGVEFPVDWLQIFWQMNIAYYQSASFQTGGIDYFYSLPQYPNRAYTYSVNSQRYLLENKAVVPFGPYIDGTDWLSGYLMLGIGMAFNNAHNYHETSLQAETPADGVFASYTESSPTYSVGAGLEAAIVNTLRVAIGYRFTDLGSSSLGDYNNGNTEDTLSKTNMLANEVLLEVIVVF